MAAIEKREGESDPILLEYEPPESQRPSAREQVERNLMIVSERARHVPVSAIAKKYGLTERRVRGIVAEWRAQNPTLRAHDPIEIIDELLYGYQATIEDLNKILEVHPTDNIAVGAMNTKLRAYREMGELLQAVGVLPHDLGTLNIVVDGQIVAERIITVLERFGVPEEVFDGILDAIGPGATPAEP